MLRTLLHGLLSWFNKCYEHYYTINSPGLSGATNIMTRLTLLHDLLSWVNRYYEPYDMTYFPGLSGTTNLMT